MRRTLQIGAGLGLALLIATCTDRSPTGPGRHGAAAFNLAALTAAAPGAPPIPLDSARIVVRRASDLSVMKDITVALAGLDSTGDTAQVLVDVPLDQDNEAVTIAITVTGGGFTWYNGSTSATLSAGATVTPATLTLAYVGPGFDADSVRIQLAGRSFVGGFSNTVAAAVWVPGGVLTGVPVGYRIANSAVATLGAGSLNTTTITGQVPVHDSTWIYAETPTHQRDSLRITIIPPAASLAAISGTGQTGAVGVPLAAPLVVRVLDMLGGPFKGQPVSWSVTTGLATLSPPSAVTDDSGYASSTVTPTGAGALAVQASAAGLTGSPQLFALTVVGAGGAVASVTLDRGTDTIPRGDSLQYTATLKDANGTVIPGTVTWASTVPGVASVTGTGLAMGQAGGLARIVAASGGFADTADLWIRDLTTISVQPADTVITAVGDSLTLSAVALDNFGDTVASGVVIRYLSATPTVATVGATTGKVHLVGPGNAVVLARDSVSGVQGPATLRVNQIPVALANTADTLVVGVQGRGQIVARTLDRNGFPIPGKTVGWRSGDVNVATVDQFGVVTGVSLGLIPIVDSLVDSAGVFFDTTMASVVAAPPALIQWAFDSTAVGNGGNLSVALSLTRASPTPLTVLLASSDSFIAQPAVKRVVFPANVTATSVVINGLSAGRVTLVAADSAAIYVPDTMVVTVVSTIEFREIGSFSRQQYFYVNRNQTYLAQVFLSDPAPAGGLGVTFVYGRPGTSAVTPSPAIIPAGQLSADVTIQGLSAAVDSVVPTSGGFVGRFAYVAVAPESLRIQQAYPYTGVLGLGQTFQPYLYFTYAMDHPLTISLALTPAIGTAPATVTIPTNSNYVYFTLGATAPGSATLTATAPGWIGTSLPVVFSTPHLSVSGTTFMVAGDPSHGSWSASTVDSLQYGHPVIDTVVVTAVSRNTLAVVVDSAVGKVRPNNASVGVANALRALAPPGGDSAWIVMTAPGYVTDSFLVHVTAPAMTTQIGYPYDGRVGLGTFFQNAGYVSIPYVRPDTLWVRFTHTRRGVTGGPDSVAIFPGTTYSYFDVRGDSLGSDAIAVDTVGLGYLVSTGPMVYSVSPLRVRPYNYPSTLYTISPPQLVSATAVDSADGIARPLLAPLVVALTSGNPGAYTLDSATVTIPSGSAYSNYDTLRVVPGGLDSIGSRIIASATGAASDSSGLITVQPTPLGIGLGYPYAIGAGLKLPFNYVYITGGNAPDTVHVALQNLVPGIDSIAPDTVLILKGQSTSQYFTIFGLDTTATDTIVAQDSGYIAGRATIRPQPSRLDVSDAGNHLTTDPSFRLRTYTELRSGYGLRPTVPVTYTIASSDPNVIRIDSAGSGGAVNGTRDTATAIVDSSNGYGDVWISFVGSGTARLYVSAPGFDPDSSAPVTVTGPSVSLAYTTITVGKGQVFTSQYVYVNNPVASPLVVRLTRSDSTLLPASRVFGLAQDSVVILAGNQSSPFFDLTGNANGSAQLIARATGYSQDVGVVTVGQPRFQGPGPMSLYVGEQPQPLYVYTTDQNGNYRNVALPTVVGDTLVDPAVAKTDSAARTIPTNQGVTSFFIRPLKQGATSIVFSSAGYRPDTAAITVDTAALSLQGAPNGLGAGQLAGDLYLQLPYATDSDLVVTLTSTNPGVVTVPGSVTIGAGGYLVSIPVTGVAPGTASIIATAPHSFPDTVPIVIATPKLSVSLAGSTSAGQLTTISVTARDSLNNNRLVSAPVSVTLVSSSPGHTTFTTSPLTILAGATSASTTVKFDTAGSYTVTASAAGYLGGNASTTTTGALVRIVTGNLFAPDTVTIQAGQRVTWRNDDTVPHTTTENSGTPVWNSGSLSPGQIYQRTFSLPGIYNYHCTIHGVTMKGTVIVQ